MIVTGDRDVFQLVDEEGLVRVMATARGITETKIYDRQAVIDRYGIPPELIPDFYGLKGDTSDNIPGVPGIGDKTASDLHPALRVARGGPRARRRHRRRQAQAEPRRARPGRAAVQAPGHVQRDVAVDFDPLAEAVREPDRSRLRELFREYELRDPLRRLEEALGGAEPAAPLPPAEQRLAARVRAGSVADIGSLAGEELAVAARASDVPEGALFAEGPPWRFAVAADGGVPMAMATVLAGDCVSPDEVALALGDRAVIAHDAKALGVVPPGLPTTPCSGPTCSSRRAAATRSPSCARSAGWPRGVEDPVAGDAVLIGALSAAQREEIAERGLHSLMDDIELPLVACCVRWS